MAQPGDEPGSLTNWANMLATTLLNQTGPNRSVSLRFPSLVPTTLHKKNTLGKQVALRIQIRSSVLNSVGVYNRSKLTRLVVDHEWDKKVWEESWELRNRQELIKQSMGEDCSSSI